MREIQRKIVVAIIISKDGKILLGKKNSTKGGVFPDCWHFPGGGVDENETLEQALRREVNEETGIDISPYQSILFSEKNYGTAEKTLKTTGEKVLCHMEYNYYRIDVIDRVANKINLQLGDDLIEGRWFDKSDLTRVNNVPGSQEFLEKNGII